jgi:hypothetical protein
MKVVEPVKTRERVLGIEKLFRIAALAIGHLQVVLQQLLSALRLVFLQQLLCDC